MNANDAPIGNAAQPDDLLDGLARLARIAGRPLSPTALRAQCTRGRDGGLNLDALRGALAASGLDFARGEAPLAQLGRDGLPALVALEDGRHRLVENPADLRSAGLEGAYAGHFYRVTPRPGPDMRSEIPARRNARAWFWRVLWGLRGYYIHVALATLLVNVLSIAVSLYVMNVYDRVVPNRTYETLWVLTIGTIGALVFDFVARTLRAWLADTAGKRADLEISAGLFRRLLGIQLIQKPPSSGAFVSNLRDFEAIREVLTSATLTALIDLPFFLLFVAVIAAIAPPLAIVPLVAIVAVVIVGALVQAPLARSIRDSMKESSQRQGLAVETVEGLETLKVNNAQAHAQQRWEWYTETVALASMKSRNLSNLVINATSTLQQLSTVATVVIGVYLIHDGRLSMGGLIGAVILCGRAIAPLAQVAGLAVRLQQARTAFDGLQALIDKTSERDPERSYLSLQSVRGDIGFSGVDFSHDPQGSTLFRGLNLSIRAGERVAILGRTGSGKSTLLRLAAGLYTPGAGLVTLDGIDLRQIDPADLRASVGLLPQDARLFLGSLRENLDMARADRSRDDSRLLEVLRQFGLDRFIAQHPRGIDMPLGEDGLGLSGGQKRLVCLARMALRDPAVALLDEPTSGLDPGTEQQILHSIAQWARNGRERTLVVVTHRPQVLEIVDRIVVVEQGRIIVDGPRARVVEQLQKGISVPAAEVQT
ncbi:MAG: type I secretion system permease/ATPase [Burkholderiaceae bacterium]|nr:type I secretion system permease/ATPase [Burkholderiaceae bacterium]